MPACPFCTLAPEQLVWQSELVVAIRVLHPVTPGHTLVITRRHALTYFDARPAEQAEVWRAVGELKHALDAELAPHGYNVGFNAHEAAGRW